MCRSSIMLLTTSKARRAPSAQQRRTSTAACTAMQLLLSSTPAVYWPFFPSSTAMSLTLKSKMNHKHKLHQKVQQQKKLHKKMKKVRCVGGLCDMLLPDEEKLDEDLLEEEDDTEYGTGAGGLPPDDFQQNSTMCAKLFPTEEGCETARGCEWLLISEEDLNNMEEMSRCHPIDETCDAIASETLCVETGACVWVEVERTTLTSLNVTEDHEDQTLSGNITNYMCVGDTWNSSSMPRPTGFTTETPRPGGGGGTTALGGAGGVETNYDQEQQACPPDSPQSPVRVCSSRRHLPSGSNNSSTTLPGDQLQFPNLCEAAKVGFSAEDCAEIVPFRYYWEASLRKICAQGDGGDSANCEGNAALSAPAPGSAEWTALEDAYLAGTGQYPIFTTEERATFTNQCVLLVEEERCAWEGDIRSTEVVAPAAQPLAGPATCEEGTDPWNCDNFPDCVFDSDLEHCVHAATSPIVSVPASTCAAAKTEGQCQHVTDEECEFVKGECVAKPPSGFTECETAGVTTELGCVNINDSRGVCEFVEGVCRLRDEENPPAPQG
ncbi:unnamed protein product [Amoebophrya sp. A120]|nr:unnamed protein product [Amoebophrya sp. A120]|eukprot:GSA120T00015895001.1